MAEQGPTPDIPCMNLTVAATGVYRFKVQGYSATKDMATKADQYYESDAFSAGGYDWAVRYYPRDCTRSRVVVCLVLLRRDGPLFGEFLPVTFGCTPLGKSGEPSAKMEQASSSTVHLGGDDDAVGSHQSFHRIQ
ncbi:unnamed protein product [Urochloa humidicola]